MWLLLSLTKVGTNFLNEKREKGSVNVAVCAGKPRRKYEKVLVHSS